MNSSSVDTRAACVIVLDTPPISTIYKEQKKKVKMYDDAINQTRMWTEKFNRNSRKKTRLYLPLIIIQQETEQRETEKIIIL